MLVFSCGFLTKALVVEAEKKLTTYYMDTCLGARDNPTSDEESKCYGASKNKPLYRIVTTLNFQPSFWKNTNGRCVETKGRKPYEYFECKWWNEIAL